MVQTGLFKLVVAWILQARPGGVSKLTVTLPSGIWAIPAMLLTPTFSVAVLVTMLKLEPSSATIVKGYDPGGVEALVVTTSWAVAEKTTAPVKWTGIGEKVAETPAGKLVALK